MLSALLRQSFPVARRSVAVAGPILRPQRFIAVRFQSTSPETIQRRQELQADWTAPKLTYEDVKKRTQHPTTDAYLIDVREPDEVAQGSIPSSVSLPLSTLSSSLHLRGDQFLDKHGFMKPAYNQEIVFYCRSGKRSATASDVARRNGYTNIKNYEGSWLDWVEKDRQRTTS